MSFGHLVKIVQMHCTVCLQETLMDFAPITEIRSIFGDSKTSRPILDVACAPEGQHYETIGVVDGQVTYRKDVSPNSLFPISYHKSLPLSFPPGVPWNSSAVEALAASTLGQLSLGKSLQWSREHDNLSPTELTLLG